jgi:hypothetical protein
VDDSTLWLRACAPTGPSSLAMQYQDTCRPGYIRRPEGIIVAFAEQLG